MKSCAEQGSFCVWLQMLFRNGMVIAICRDCKRRGEFTLEQWNTLGGRAINKPVRL